MKPLYISPLTIAQKEIDYSNHLKRIARIQHQRRRQFSLDQINSKKPLIHKQTTQIEQENQKLLARLLDISHRKSLTFSSIEYEPSLPTMNPYRKKLMRQIHEENQLLAERLISKQSEFSSERMNRDVKEYQRIKRSMLRNKRINLPILKKE